MVYADSLTEKRDWPERLVFAASLGLPLTAGVLSRLLLNYYAADLTLPGAFLAGLLAGPYAGAIVGTMLGIPAFIAGEWIALPFAIGCGFAGGGLREICPRKPSGTFHRSSSRVSIATSGGWCGASRSTGWSSSWRRRSALEIILQGLGYRWPSPDLPAARDLDVGGDVVRDSARDRAVCGHSDQIWNSARIEHRLQEQEKLLMATRLDALASQINPHFLFNTLTSISSLIRSKPETARTLIAKLSGFSAGCCAARIISSACAKSWSRSTSTSTSSASGSDRRCGSKKTSLPRRST